MNIIKHENDFIRHIVTIKNLSDKTIIAYKSDLNDFFNFITDSKIKEISPNTIFSYFESLSKFKKLKDTTINRKIITLKQYFTYLEEYHKYKNPFSKLKFRFKKEKKLPKTLTIYEIKLLLSILKKQTFTSTSFQQFESYRDLALIDLLISTGIRIGEACKITLNDINLVDKVILIHGKGRKERVIYISSLDTYRNIKKWLKIRKKHISYTDHLFINRYGKCLTINSIDNIFRKYKKLAKINPLATPHFLRHTFATNLLSNGADIRSVQEILGHANVSTTEIYTEVTNNRKKEVLSKYNYRNNI